MKKTILALIAISMLIAFSINIQAQSACSPALSHGSGFTTSIESVTFDGFDTNGDSLHTIILRIENDGCTDPDCKALNQYSIEAIPGTYSDISHAVLAGNMAANGINLGPSLGGTPFDGFRIASINGIGNGEAGIFVVKYTLTGGLQRQKTQIKAGNNQSIVEFQIADFAAVLNCVIYSNILPYYPPPDNGKIENSIIGAELTSLYETYVIYDSAVSNDIFQIVDDTNVIIEVIALDGKYNELLALLQTADYGMYDVNVDPDQLKITGVFPIINLLSLNDLPLLISYARPVYPGAPQVGIVTSQGDTSILAYIARNGFNVGGEGIKVGVLSDSYNTQLGNLAADDVLRGDLPGPANPNNTTPVHLLQDYPYGVASDEGRAMMQIVHDIAPKAELAFRTGLISAPDFANGIIELQEAGCDVIVDDITYISEPFLRDGVVAKAVDSVTSLGVSYFTAAGNFGNKSYQSTFNPGTTPPGLSGTAHNFAGGGADDIYQSITVTEGSYIIVLQWNDGLGSSETNTDLDIYLAYDDGSRLFGFNRVNTGGEAIEVLPFTVIDTAETNIMIVNSSGPDPVDMKFVVFRGEISFNEYNDFGGSTIVGQANAEGAITVGAVLYSNTPPYGVNPPSIASFSSVGGSLINGIDRNKPDISAPNGVNTTVDLGGFDIDGDPFPNFFGTSASAPHAAGLAALLLEAKHKFYGPDSTLTPVQMRNIMQSTAINMETPGLDNSSGAGLIQADEALLVLATPSPYISAIIYDTSLVPGQDSIPIAVIGEYLTEDSEIYFNGVPLDSTSSLSGDTMVSGVIPPYDDRYPGIQVFNPPNVLTNGNDGGLSNPLYFSSRPTVIVNIDDRTKKFAEVIPQFTASYRVQTPDTVVSLAGAGLSPAAIARITSIPLVTVASDTSNVGLWEIIASLDDPLNPLSTVAATDPLDTTLLAAFNFDFENGLLSIEKLDLKIIPKDTIIIFGDTLLGFDFEYVYNNDTINPENNIVIADPVDEAILSAMKQAHATALVNAVGTVRATALVNGEPLMDSTDLANTSFFITNAVMRKQATALVNGTLIDPQQLWNTISASSATALVNAIATVRATALVNGWATVLVNGFATALVNTGALVNGASTGSVSATALVNTNTVNDSSNSDAIVVLDEEDVLILGGDSIGDVEIVSISMITGNTVGQHWSIPGAWVSNNYNITYGLGNIIILPDTTDVVFDPESLIQTYDGIPKEATVTTDPDTLYVNFTYNGDPTPPVDAGSYLVEATVDDPNYVGSTTDTMIITAATAYVTADIKVIFEGDPLPVFTSTFSGFVNGDDSTVVSSLTYTVGSNYNGAAGSYDIIPTATASNYTIIAINGTLYVNPSGPGTKHIKTTLLCVEDIPPDSSGFTFIAHFEYENKNSSGVFIFIGEDNELIGEGSFNGINQPELFLKGGGTFDVPFDGSKLTWTVASYNHQGHKTSVASQASSSSSKCNKSDEIEQNDEILNAITESIAYPNPVRDRVHIELKQEVSANDIFVYDVYGKPYPVQVSHSTNQSYELDFSGLISGIYIIKINMVDAIETFRIVKQ